MSSLAEPIELCLESMDQDPNDEPYVRCVAISGAEPGLGIAADGSIVWQKNDVASALLWVSADNRLILVRARDSETVRLMRAERILELPLDKPVVVLDQDLVFVEQHSFRIHVHGVAQVVQPPARLSLRRMQSMVVGAAIAAVSMAGCRTAGGNASASAAPIASSDAPSLSTGGTSSVASVVAVGGAYQVLTATEAQGGTEAAQGSSARVTTNRTPPIEIRHHPPKPMVAPEYR